MPAEKRYDQSFDRYNNFVLGEYFTNKPGIFADKGYATDPPTKAQVIAGDVAQNNFGIAGTNSTTALSTFSATGGILLTTAGADADQMLLCPHTTAGESDFNTAQQWNPSKSPIMRCLISTQASIANIIIFAGFKLTNTPVVATDDDQAYFRYAVGDTEATHWQFIVSRANVDNVYPLNSTVSPTYPDVPFKLQASTLYELVIAADTVGVNASINGHAVFSQPLPALTQAANLFPFIGVQASGNASAKAVGVKWIECAKPWTA